MRALLLLALLLQASAATAADAAFLWVVQGERTQHYLAGSVHLLPEQAYPLPAALERAYARSAGLVLESDLEELASPAMQQKWLAAALAPKGLAAEINPALLRSLKRHNQQQGLPELLCDRFKAWFCAVTLEIMSLQRAGMRADLGLDRTLFDRADAAGKQVRWLETPDQQLQLFAGISGEFSEQMLASTLDELGTPGRSAQDLVRQWMAGDVAAVETAVSEMKAEFPAAYARLLSERNRSWLPQLQKIFEEAQPQMIVVGSAHLVGPDGLPALLAARGLTVKPVAVEEIPRQSGSGR